MPKPKQRRVRIVARKLGREKAWGIYHTPPRKNGTPIIELDPRQSGKHLLDTVLHESLHHAFPEKGEEEIAAAAGDVTEILWVMGFRMVNLE